MRRTRKKTKTPRSKRPKKRWYMWGIVERGGDDWLTQGEIRAKNMVEARKIGQRRKKKFAKRHGYTPGQLTSLIDRPR